MEDCLFGLDRVMDLQNAVVELRSRRGSFFSYGHGSVIPAVHAVSIDLL